MSAPSSPLEELVLAGRTMDATISEAITSAEYEHGLEQAATLTLGLHDPNRVLVRSDRHRADHRAPRPRGLCSCKCPGGPDLTLTEDQVVNALRQVKGASVQRDT